MNKFLNEALIHISEKAVSIAPRLIVSLIILFTFLALAFILNIITVKIGRGKDTDKSKVFKLIGSSLKVITIIIGLITALGTLGIDVTAMVAGLGLTGFALGFALKDALSNLLAGALILFYHPFGCGDKIKVSGCEGVVTDINLRYTKLQNDNIEFLIPNSTCFTNWIATKKDSSE